MARPLTRRDKTGKVYTRPPKIDLRIDSALALDIHELKRQLRVTSRTSSDYLPSECLVHLIRDAMRRGDEAVLDVTIDTLLKRCEANLKAKIYGNHLGGIDDLCQEALGEFSEKLASDMGGNADELDYYECKFNSAFHAFRVDFLRRQERQAKAIADPPSPEDGDEADELFPWDGFSTKLQTAAAQDDEVFRRQILEAINALPTEERKAVILRMRGYEIDSKDPKKRTIAKLLGVSGRTIQNYLGRAAAKLSRFKE